MQVQPTKVESEREFLSGFKLAFQSITCPTCRQPMRLDYVFIGSWPYVHADVCLRCVCGEKLLFGVPEDPVKGMEVIIWDSHPLRVLQQVQALPTPECPFHKTPMHLTKIWGDRVGLKGQLRVQWKCPKDFLTHHAWLDR